MTKATFRFASSELNTSCLEDYFAKQEKKNIERLPGIIANSQTAAFKADVLNLTNRLDIFLTSAKREISYLVLGKVQSGKTAHMVGALAWAADSQVAFAVAFTGVSEALNDQTASRFEKDLVDSSAYVKIFSVPTSSRSGAYENLRSEVFQFIEWRLSRSSVEQVLSPLPILVTLKNQHRVTTLRRLMVEISEHFGHEVCGVLIDDEADQASQNAKASKSEVAATYAAISGLRDLELRNILLSYTATPQAVLLTERFGRLRPDHCVVVNPRVGYFGIDDAVAENYASNRIIVSDGTDSTTITSIPLSLKNSILEFFVTTLFRKNFPQAFYRASGLPANQLVDRMQSTQMLIHESSRVANHTAMFKFVRSECISLREAVRSYLQGEMSKSASRDFEHKLLAIFGEINSRLGDFLKPSELENFAKRLLPELLYLLNQNKIIVVNGDKKRPTAEIPIPSSDSDWETNPTWILIGGDILGRGLTIPQLVTTYFLRQAKKPNFDTVSQQMRFCGYRKDYEGATTIHAPSRVFELFSYMRQIDSIVWARANIWDKMNLDIKTSIPPVMYASPIDAPIAPTRKSVQDPNLVDRAIGESVFSFRDIFQPLSVRANCDLIRNWKFETSASFVEETGYLKFEHVEVHAFQRLLSGWHVGKAESNQLRSAVELFELGANELGLNDFPITIFINEKLISIPKLRSDCTQWIDSIEVTRSLSKTSKKNSLVNWKESFSKNTSPSHNFAPLGVGHIGEGQRKFKREMPYDSTVLLIEPILGLTESRKRTSAQAVGIGCTLFAPDNFEVRVIGHL